MNDTARLAEESAEEAAEVSGRAKTLPEAKAWMRKRLATRTHPMNALPADEGKAWIDDVPGLDGQAWGHYWGHIGDGILEQAQRAEQSGSGGEASALFQKASGAYFMGRFPCPDHPLKERCAVAEREAYIAGSRHWKAPIRRVAIPFAGRADEGHEVVMLVRMPHGMVRPPVVIMWAAWMHGKSR